MRWLEFVGMECKVIRFVKYIDLAVYEIFSTTTTIAYAGLFLFTLTDAIPCKKPYNSVL